MQFLDALQLIRKHYNTLEYSEDIEVIKINKLLDFSNFYFIALIDNDGQAILSDMGKTGELIELPQEEWSRLASEYDINYSEYTLSTPINDIKDLYNFITLLDSVAKDN